MDVQHPAAIHHGSLDGRFGLGIEEGDKMVDPPRQGHSQSGNQPEWPGSLHGIGESSALCVNTWRNSVIDESVSPYTVKAIAAWPSRSLAGWQFTRIWPGSLGIFKPLCSRAWNYREVPARRLDGLSLERSRAYRLCTTEPPSSFHQASVLLAPCHSYLWPGAPDQRRGLLASPAPSRRSCLSSPDQGDRKPVSASFQTSGLGSDTG